MAREARQPGKGLLRFPFAATGKMRVKGQPLPKLESLPIKDQSGDILNAIYVEEKHDHTPRPISVVDMDFSVDRGGKAAQRRMEFLLKNGHPRLHLVELRAHHPRATCVPELPAVIASKTSGSTHIIPEPAARNRGVFYYRVVHAGHIEEQRQPYVFLAFTWDISSREPRRFFVDLVYAGDSKQDAHPTARHETLLDMLAAEVNRGGKGHPRWCGRLPLDGTTGVGCALHMRIVSETPLKVQVTLGSLPSTNGREMPGLDLRPTLWYPLEGFCCATEAGTQVRERIISYAAEIRAFRARNQPASSVTDDIATPTVAIIENLHAELRLRRHAVDPSLAHDAGMAAHGAYGKEVLTLGADAFATIGHQRQCTLAGYVIYRLVGAAGSSEGMEQHADYLVVSWTPADTYRSFYCAEFVRASAPMSPADASCRYALLLFTVLSRAERGHRVRREASLDAGAHHRPNIMDYTTLIAYMSPERQPTLSVQVATTQQQAPLLPLEGVATGSSKRVRRLSPIRITVENLHPTLILEDYQSFLVACANAHGNAEHPDEETGIACGELRTFYFLPISTRQLGVLTFTVRESQSISSAPCMVIAWRQAVEHGRDLFFHASVMTQDDSNSGANSAGQDGHGRVSPLVNLYPTVHSKRRHIFAQQHAGQLPNGVRFAVTTTLYRRRKSGELEATICLSADIGESDEARNAPEQPLSEGNMVINLQNFHPRMQLIEPHVYALDGQVTDWTSVALHPGKAGTIHVRQSRVHQQDSTSRVTGFALVRLDNFRSQDIPPGAYLLLGWRLCGAARHIYANVLSFGVPPIDRLRDAEACRRFFHGLLEPHLQPAGQEIAQCRILIPDTPGLFFWASMDLKGEARLEVMLRQLSSLPLHALSATPTLACRRRTTRRERRKRPPRRLSAPDASVVVVQGELLPAKGYDDTHDQIDSNRMTYGEENGRNSTAASWRRSMSERSQENYEKSLSNPSVLIIDDSMPQANPDDSVTAQLPGSVDEEEDMVENETGNRTMDADSLGVVPDDWESSSVHIMEAESILSLDQSVLDALHPIMRALTIADRRGNAVARLQVRADGLGYGAGAGAGALPPSYNAAYSQYGMPQPDYSRQPKFYEEPSLLLEEGPQHPTTQEKLPQPRNALPNFGSISSVRGLPQGSSHLYTAELDAMSLSIAPPAEPVWPHPPDEEASDIYILAGEEYVDYESPRTATYPDKDADGKESTTPLFSPKFPFAPQAAAYTLSNEKQPEPQAVPTETDQFSVPPRHPGRERAAAPQPPVTREPITSVELANQLSGGMLSFVGMYLAQGRDLSASSASCPGDYIYADATAQWSLASNTADNAGVAVTLVFAITAPILDADSVEQSDAWARLLLILRVQLSPDGSECSLGIAARRDDRGIISPSSLHHLQNLHMVMVANPVNGTTTRACTFDKRRFVRVTGEWQQAQHRLLILLEEGTSAATQ
ncbi:hypothetical protein THASP1DRAFT_31344 [Thamnocephalis sphaerospora]|uniref:Uncharacterized protein n=1 Tax=Thamnocephalis sphaerospora TaxID=78915 RepID=A0A4P9XLT1_9FUNG|nr:hypothetical protein THASP1DRAFT_31344 [Thamnocephalis sphaerospora]|eukprot:RKP06847.1 hypothetical protein THASP1DRAFT_31344 [Thamnocephalis sphaerospora]